MRIVITRPLRLPAVLRRLGGAGACDNAYRACEEHELALLRIDAIGRRLSADQDDLSVGPPAGERRGAQLPAAQRLTARRPA